MKNRVEVIANGEAARSKQTINFKTNNYWLTNDEPENYIESIKRSALERKSIWSKALATADGNVAVAESLLYVSGSKFGHYITLDAEGLYSNEKSEINNYESLKTFKRQKSRSYKAFVERYKNEESMAKCVNNLKHLAFVANVDVDCLNNVWQKELLYGPREVDLGHGLVHTVNAWCRLIDKSYGDINLALIEAKQYGMENMPEEYLLWLQEKELLFGSASAWKEALIEAKGDIANAATVMGLEGFDYEEIVKMLGLCRFAYRLEREWKKPDVKFIIYGLQDPRTLEVRWVGQSKNGLRRPEGMLGKTVVAKNTYGCGDWLRELKALNIRPSIVVLEELNSIDSLNAAERKHIAAWRAKIGDRLTNIAKGGAEKVRTYTNRTNDPILVLKATGGSLSKAADMLGKQPSELENSLTTGQKLWLAEIQSATE